MSIWTYGDWTVHGLKTAKALDHCPFCQTPLRMLVGPSTLYWPLDYLGNHERDDPSSLDAAPGLSSCSICGWWLLEQRSGYAYGRYEGEFVVRRAGGVLKHLDASDLSVPSDELTKYLTAKYDTRYALNPRKFELIVASVFRDAGYQVRVTSYSGDDGIDLIVCDSQAGETLGVQIKRYGNRIEAEQIRAFGGALVLAGMTRGIFVTTSAFTRGAASTARRFSAMGLAVELEDGERFFDRLRLSRRDPYDSVNDPSAPFYPLWQSPSTMRVAVRSAWD